MDSPVFTTERIAEVLKLPTWRVVRFAQVEDYGITPYYADASGPGSRRLYSLENVCEIALASWLVQAGLQVKVIGRVLEQVRKQGGLSHLLSPDEFKTYLGVVRSPNGKSSSQETVFIRNWKHLEDASHRYPFTSVLLVPIGLNLYQLNARLERAGKGD